MRRRGWLAAAGAAAGVGAALAVERGLVARRRRDDPEAGEPFGQRRGERSSTVARPDGASLFVEEVGATGPRAAVFLHGSILRTDLWHYQMAGLGGHRLAFVDLRGHGRSRPKGDAEYSIVTLADDLLAVIEDRALEEVVLVGHSVGGAVVMELCRQRPDLVGRVVKGVVLVCTSYRPFAETTMGGTALARLERLVRNPFDALGGRSAYVDRLRRLVKPSDTVFLAVSFAAFGSHASARQIDFAYDMLADTSSDVIFDLIRSYRDFDMREHLADIDVPALVVGGTADRITVPEASEHLAQNLRKAELKLFDGCGHMPMLERHREFNALLERFLDEHLGDPEGGR